MKLTKDQTILLVILSFALIGTILYFTLKSSDNECPCDDPNSVCKDKKCKCKACFTKDPKTGKCTIPKCTDPNSVYDTKSCSCICKPSFSKDPTTGKCIKDTCDPCKIKGASGNCTIDKCPINRSTCTNGTCDCNTVGDFLKFLDGFEKFVPVDLQAKKLYIGDRCQTFNLQVLQDIALILCPGIINNSEKVHKIIEDIKTAIETRNLDPLKDIVKQCQTPTPGVY